MPTEKLPLRAEVAGRRGGSWGHLPRWPSHRVPCPQPLTLKHPTSTFTFDITTTLCFTDDAATSLPSPQAYFSPAWASGANAFLIFWPALTAREGCLSQSGLTSRRRRVQSQWSMADSWVGLPTTSTDIPVPSSAPMDQASLFPNNWRPSRGGDVRPGASGQGSTKAALPLPLPARHVPPAQKVSTTKERVRAFLPVEGEEPVQS